MIIHWIFQIAVLSLSCHRFFVFFLELVVKKFYDSQSSMAQSNMNEWMCLSPFIKVLIYHHSLIESAIISAAPLPRTASAIVIVPARSLELKFRKQGVFQFPRVAFFLNWDGSPTGWRAYGDLAIVHLERQREQLWSSQESYDGLCWTNLIATAIFTVVSTVLWLILILSMQLLYKYLDILSILEYDIDRLLYHWYRLIIFKRVRTSCGLGISSS